MQRINADNLEESLRIQREEGQYAQHKQTQTENIGAYQTETQTQIGVAGANALGQMGANGAGNIDLGNSGGGFNPATMMAGMALGSAVGQNIANTMNNAMSGMHNSGAAESVSPIAPPPVPEITYHVAENGQPTGPFNKTVLGQMITNGQLTEDSLVWKPGMAEWVAAGSIEELKVLFNQYTIPPLT